MAESPETLLWTGRPSVWKWPLECALAITLALGGIGLAGLGSGKFALVAWACSAVLFAGLAFRRLACRYTVTTQRVRARTGLLSRRETEVELRDIRNLNLRQSLFQRLAGVGDVEVSSAAGEEVEVLLDSIHDPDGVKEAIRKARVSAGAGAGE